MGAIPKEAEALLSASPDDFVAERTKLARELRDAGRKEDAAKVTALRKPAPVVLAANHAARRRPPVVKDAARAAKRLRKKHDADARETLDAALGILEEVAIAFLGEPSEATRRRVHDLFRNVVADDEALTALTRGVMTDEPEPAGFAAYSGTSLAPPKAAKAKPGDSRARKAAEAKRRAREQALVDGVAAAESRVEEAAAAEKQAARDRAQAERALDEARARLERFRAD